MERFDSAGSACQGVEMADSIDEHGLVLWPAPERNKQPILEQLQRVLGASDGLLLEVASATGQHAVHFVRHLPGWTIQPSDYDSDYLETLRRRVELESNPRLLLPVELDVTQPVWPIPRADAIYNANMVHIAPWSVAEGLFHGAGTLLEAGAPLITYGPYQIDGRHTSESNQRFDQSLRDRDPEWGVRDLADLAVLAARHGLRERERVAMPSNNFLIVWEKG